MVETDTSPQPFLCDLNSHQLLFHTKIKSSTLLEILKLIFTPKNLRLYSHILLTNKYRISFPFKMLLPPE